MLQHHLFEVPFASVDFSIVCRDEALSGLPMIHPSYWMFRFLLESGCAQSKSCATGNSVLAMSRTEYDKTKKAPSSLVERIVAHNKLTSICMNLCSYFKKDSSQPFLYAGLAHAWHSLLETQNKQEGNRVLNSTQNTLVHFLFIHLSQTWEESFSTPREVVLSWNMTASNLLQ